MYIVTHHHQKLVATPKKVAIEIFVAFGTVVGAKGIAPPGEIDSLCCRTLLTLNVLRWLIVVNNGYLNSGK